jgi:hypothetical protein
LFVPQHSFRLCDLDIIDELMRRFAKRLREQPEKVKFRKSGLTGDGP